MTLRICKSTDEGAPAINQAVGSVETLLDAVLVNGYGQKSPLGWSVHFRNDSTGRKYYRQGAGSTGRVLMIQDAAQNASAFSDHLANVALAHPIAQGIEPAGTIGLAAGNGIERPDNYWEVIGDESCFYLLSGRNAWGGQYGLRSIFACGDILGYAENDQGRAIIAQNARSGSGSRPAGQWALPIAVNSVGGTMSSGQGRLDFAGMLEGMGVVPHEQVFRITSPCSFDALNFPGVARVLSASPLVLGVVESQAAANFSFRGEFPGLRVPLIRQASHQPAPFSIVAGVGRDAGRSFTVVYSADSAQSGTLSPWLMIETSDTWGL